MDSAPSPQTNTTSAAPEPEVLKTRVAETSVEPASATTAQQTAVSDKKPRHRTYRPSHKATFIGLAVVVMILAINAAIIGFVLRKQDKEKDLFNKGQVSISTEDLNKLGVNRSVIGDSGVELVVSPDAQFKGKVIIAGSTIISGAVTLNDKLTVPNISSTQLQAGNTSIGTLNVNSDTSLSNLNVREKLVVAGATSLQGPVNISNALAVNSLTVTGNLSIGGKLSVGSFSIHHLGGSGATPSVSVGPKLGSNGTVSISGTDTAGTVVANAGAGAGSGTLINITFKTAYGSSPSVVITPVGTGGNFYVTNVTTGGFAIGVSGALAPAGYKFNYIVIE